jgi:methionyl-tRNA formyltransferase
LRVLFVHLPPVLVLGYGQMGTALVRGVLACPDIAMVSGIFPWPGSPEPTSPGGRLQTLAMQHQLPLIQAKGANHFRFMQILFALKPHVVLVGSWGEILEPYLLAIPDTLFINCHPSLLPLHKGPNPFIAAILSGDTHTGVTFHQMDAGIDTGPITMQSNFPISEQDTGGALRDRCANLAQLMTPLLLHQIASDTLRLQAQPLNAGSYERMTPSITHIHWPTDGPEDIMRRARGLFPWYRVTVRRGPWELSFGGAQWVPSLPASLGASPGMITRQTRQGLQISTCDPTGDIWLTDPQLTGMGRALQWVIQPLAFGPGQRCETPPKQNGFDRIIRP